MGSCYVATPVDAFPDVPEVVVVPSGHSRYYGPPTHQARQLADDIGAVVTRSVRGLLDDILHQHRHDLADAHAQIADKNAQIAHLQERIDAKGKKAAARRRRG
jgi:hypothetical protein